MIVLIFETLNQEAWSGYWNLVYSNICDPTASTKDVDKPVFPNSYTDQMNKVV